MSDGIIDEKDKFSRVFSGQMYVLFFFVLGDFLFCLTSQPLQEHS